MLYYNVKLKRLARTLRKNMTDAERALWFRLRMKQLKGLQFYRQRTIGEYIVDFYCPNARLAVEVDGQGHYSDIGRANDKMREAYFMKQRIKVLRFSNREVLKDIDAVIEAIFNVL